VALTYVLLFFHLLGAFCFFAGGAVVGVLQNAAMRRERPSEIHAFLRLAPVGAALVGLGALLTLGFGIALAEHEGFGLSPAWIQTALGLWVAAMVVGGYGGRTARHARHLAKKLAAEGDAPSPELRALVAARGPLWASYASFLMLLAIVVLMVWQPGSPAPAYSTVVPVSDQQQIASEQPQIAYVPTRIPAGYSYLEQKAGWPTRFELWFVRFRKQGRAPEDIDFAAREGQCPKGRPHRSRMNGVEVSWGGTTDYVWRCIPATGRTVLVLEAALVIPGVDNPSLQRRHASELATVVAYAKPIR
jgi:uncharacterized membrane protein